MTQTVSHATQSHSRLIRFLSELDVVDFDITQRDFAERLGLLLNFADSILLSDALKLPPKLPQGVESPTPHSVRGEFLRVRGKLVAAIIDSCTPGSETARIKWPVLQIDVPQLQFEPFLRFYVAHQRDMDLGARGLRTTVREAMTHQTPALQQLITLDIALEDALFDHSRRFLAVIPRFLEKRFNALQEQSHTMADWLTQFRKELQGLLLAELEIRLQPVLGLVETLDNEVSKAT